MMTDWKAGDLALCVSDYYDKTPGDEPWWPRAGSVHAVIAVVHEELGVFLEFAEDPDRFNPDMSWSASFFRRLDPHTEDEDDREVIAHMIYAPVSHDVKQSFAAEKGE